MTTCEPFIVAELSANHMGSFALAKEMIETAAWAGCDAAKIQLYKPEHLTLKCRTDKFLCPPDSPWAGKYLWDLYSTLQTPWDWFEPLMEHGRKHNVTVFASVYHPEGVAFAKSKGNPIYKIASYDCNYTDLLHAVAVTDKPILLSMFDYHLSTPSAYAVAHDIFQDRMTCLLAIKPFTDVYDMPLARMVEIKNGGTNIGLSDHSHNTANSLTMLRIGAGVFEYHLTLRGDAPDASFSRTPGSLHYIVKELRTMHMEMQKPLQRPTYCRKDIDGHKVRTVT